MATMNISLPDALRDFVKERVEQDAYSNPSDYVRSLIREDRQRLAAEKMRDSRIEALRQSVFQGVKDAEAGRMHDLDDVVVRVKQRGRERLAKREK
jgi:antitoxin ParD1/3/4